MYYITSAAENDNYGNPHFPAKDGDIALPAEFLNDYLATRGFAILTVENGVITAVAKNVPAYNAYIAEHPDIVQPTELERLEAQILYTALMTDTLMEE